MSFIDLISNIYSYSSIVHKAVLHSSRKNDAWL